MSFDEAVALEKAAREALYGLMIVHNGKHAPIFECMCSTAQRYVSLDAALKALDKTHDAGTPPTPRNT